MVVRVGASTSEITGRKAEIAMVYVHPRHHRIRNDIAVVELKKPLEFGKTVQPIKLPTGNETLKPGTWTVVTGYGITDKKNYNNTLESIAVPIIGRKECNRYYKDSVEEYMICAGFKEGGSDACQVRGPREGF